MPTAVRGSSDRTNQLVIAGLVILFMAGVSAAVFWTQSSSAGTTGIHYELPPMSEVGGALALGDPNAPAQVTIYENFGSPAARSWDMTTRDFLRADAAEGRAYVVYRPDASTTSPSGGYSATALQAYTSVLASGKPMAAWLFSGLLYDDQPAPGTSLSLPRLAALARDAQASAAVVRTIEAQQHAATSPAVATANATAKRLDIDTSRQPVVILNGVRATASSQSLLANQLERRLAREPATIHEHRR